MNRLFIAFIRTILPISILMFGIQTGHAASATWLASPPNGDWNNAANWTPGGPPNGPFDVATFATSSQTAVSFSDSVEVDGIVFNAGGSSYTFFLSGVSLLFTLSGAGISNNSGFVQNFVADGLGTVFMNGATAGINSHYTVTSDLAGAQHALFFFDNSSANSAIFTNDGASASGASAGAIYFTDSATAGTGMFTNNGGALSGANGASMFFSGNSTADNSNLTMNGGQDNGASGAIALFTDTASAGSAILIANGGVVFGAIGAFIGFDLDSSGGTSRIQLFGNGSLNISTHNLPGLTIGSLEGNGNVFLGGLNLTVGGNNVTTAFSGVISDQGLSGSLTKVGTGTLALLAANAYSGGTTLLGGTLSVGTDGALGTGNVTLAPGAILLLGGGANNDYFADTATLTIVTGSVANLNFTGTPDTIRSLIIDGVPQADGLYGSVTSGAPNPVQQFGGSGTILVTAQPTPTPTPGPPVIISPLTASAIVGQPFVYQFEATNADKLNVSGLPSGLFFDANLSAILGTPTTQGTFPVDLTAFNSFGQDNETLVLTVQPAPGSGPVIISSSSAKGRTGQANWSFRVITTGGTPAARINASGLPPGLTINSVTGLISGTPAVDGSTTVNLTVTDGSFTTTGTVQLTFTSDPTVPVIISPNSAALSPGQFFSYTINAPTSVEPTDPTMFTLVGTLPAGLSFNAATGTISGTPGGLGRGTGGGTTNRPDLAGGTLLGSVQLFASNSHGTSTFQLLFVAAPTGTVNISTRLQVGTSENVLIGGFIITGNAPKVVIIRAVGPSTGIPGALQDPTLELHDSANNVVLNDNWRDSQEQIIRDTGIAPIDDRESAIVVALDPGNYTAIVAGKNGTTGIGLVEVYDLGTASLDTSGIAKLAQISTRGTVLSDDSVMIGGFINAGQTTRVIVRAIGPSLQQAGITNALPDPVLELHGPNGFKITNNNWRDTQEDEIIETGVPPTNNLESAIVATLPPGPYTAVVRGNEGAMGVALIEVYALQ